MSRKTHGGDEHQLELVEAAKDAAKATESSDAPLDCLAASVE